VRPKPPPASSDELKIFFRQKAARTGAGTPGDANSQRQQPRPGARMSVRTLLRPQTVKFVIGFLLSQQK
jgi:hypothetical protein